MHYVSSFSIALEEPSVVFKNPLNTLVKADRLEWIPRSQLEPLSHITLKGGFKEGVPKNANTEPWSDWELQSSACSLCTKVFGPPRWPALSPPARPPQGLLKYKGLKYKGLLLKYKYRDRCEPLPAGKARQGEILLERLTEEREKPRQPLSRIPGPSLYHLGM